jgi:hypothetical protein
VVGFSVVGGNRPPPPRQEAMAMPERTKRVHDKGKHSSRPVLARGRRRRCRRRPRRRRLALLTEYARRRVLQGHAVGQVARALHLRSAPTRDKNKTLQSMRWC